MLLLHPSRLRLPSLSLKLIVDSSGQREIKKRLQRRRLLQTHARENVLERFPLKLLIKDTIRSQTRTNHIIYPSHLILFELEKSGQCLNRHGAIVTYGAKSLDRAAKKSLHQLGIGFEQLHRCQPPPLKFDHVLIDKGYQLPESRILRHEVRRNRKHCGINGTRLQRIETRNPRAHRQNHNFSASLNSI